MPRRSAVKLDHIVLEVRDPGNSLTFYNWILGLARVREREFLQGEAPFASVRINEDSLIDLFPRRMWRGRKPVNPNHFCLTFSDSELQKLKRRLKANGIEVVQRSKHNFGARGYAESIYIHDPDGVVVEARHYPAIVRRRRTRR